MSRFYRRREETSRVSSGLSSSSEDVGREGSVLLLSGGEGSC
jgi:hypothetical protein